MILWRVDATPEKTPRCLKLVPHSAWFDDTPGPRKRSHPLSMLSNLGYIAMQFNIRAFAGFDE